MPIHFQQASFLTSAAKLSQLPADVGIEVAFAGRSNAGKSSALNVLTQQKRLARTSKTPGRTQLINLFSLDDSRRLVDLPGYGYAKVAEDIKQRWQRTLAAYLAQRTCLKGLVLLVDIRHGIKPLDQTMIDWAMQCALPLHIMLTKADKVNNNQKAKQVNAVKALVSSVDFISVQVFSALTREGLDNLKKQLFIWYA